MALSIGKPLICKIKVSFRILYLPSKLQNSEEREKISVLYPDRSKSGTFSHFQKHEIESSQNPVTVDFEFERKIPCNGSSLVLETMSLRKNSLYRYFPGTGDFEFERKKSLCRDFSRYWGAMGSKKTLRYPPLLKKILKNTGGGIWTRPAPAAGHEVTNIFFCIS